jgi:hypothetical protein
MDVRPGDPDDEREAFEYGYERDRLSSGANSLDYRWWLYASVPGSKLRPQRPRLGVPDHGFRFARGGRADSEEHAKRLLSAALREADREVDHWRGQPSHALGRGGELVPLIPTALELLAGGE